MSTAAQYYWNFSNKFGQFSGYLNAVDARDAVSHILTQDIAFSAKLFGEEYEVPIEVLDGAPGNLTPLYEATTDNYAFRVQRLS
jgi:hypothetical protein